MKAHPYFSWSLIAALLTSVIVFIFHRYIDVSPLWVYLLAINGVSYSLYRYDKLIASRKAANRIPNQVLLMLAAVGGSAGALLGIYWEGHKTRRKYLWLRVGVWFSLFAHLILVYRGYVENVGR
jgi:uncharacterized membrane protein YsdA (DUF1294 family)